MQARSRLWHVLGQYLQVRRLHGLGLGPCLGLDQCPYQIPDLRQIQMHGLCQIPDLRQIQIHGQRQIHDLRQIHGQGHGHGHGLGHGLGHHLLVADVHCSHHC